MSYEPTFQPMFSAAFAPVFNSSFGELVWILADGTWDDSAQWDDSATWND